MNKVVAIIISALCTFMAFFIVDCYCGTTKFFECKVTDKQYKPAWTETHTSTDSDGNIHLDTTYHPEEYHVYCDEYAGDIHFDCLESAAFYHSLTNTQPVTVKTRKGKWTGGYYIPRISQ